MHKVKKHWVVKGGVAGAMIVGSVGAPMVPHLVHAAETEAVDPGDGEEIKTKSLEEVQEETPTVESTTAAVPEVAPEVTNETEEPETVEETAATTEESTEETKEAENTEDTKTAETSEASERQARVVENEDGTKTYRANEDEMINIEFFDVLDSDGNTSTLVSNDHLADNGVRLSLKVNATENEILKEGDKIFIPVSVVSVGFEDRNYNLAFPDSSVIDGLGTLSRVEGGVEITISNKIEEPQKFEISYAGAKGSTRPSFYPINGLYSNGEIVYNVAGLEKVTYYKR